MKNLRNFLIIVTVVVMFSCQSPVSVDTAGPLEGVWELVTAEWKMGDSTIMFSAVDNEGSSTKYYTESHFCVIGKMDQVYALQGTYSVHGDTCVEVIGMNPSGEMSGENVMILYKVKGDTLKLKSDWFKETWSRIE